MHIHTVKLERKENGRCVPHRQLLREAILSPPLCSHLSLRFPSSDPVIFALLQLGTSTYVTVTV